MMWHAIHDSGFIITDSEFTKRDILQSFRVMEDKIVAIPLGVSEEFHREIPRRQVEAFKAKFKLEQPYILFVGNTKPHKGLPVLLNSFKETVRTVPELELVIVGGSLEGDAEMQGMIQSPALSTKVRTLGRLSDEELILVYKGAEMFVLPSLYEGFGLPALEAMACGIPVIVSDAGSLPEVVGNAAIICKSGNNGMFAEAMINLFRDSALKASMVEKGKSRSKLFSWRETARKTLEVYDKIS
jgi:glycosyltransferase involved in cell wall biosynthesis